MSEPKAAALTGALLAQKGTARPAVSSDPAVGPPDSEQVDVLEPPEYVEEKDLRADGATLAPGLVNVQPLDPSPAGGSELLRAEPRNWWNEAEVLEVPDVRSAFWKRPIWILVALALAVIAVALVILNGRTTDTAGSTSNEVEISSAPAAGTSVIVRDRPSVRATLPPPVGNTNVTIESGRPARIGAQAAVLAPISDRVGATGEGDFRPASDGTTSALQPGAQASVETSSTSGNLRFPEQKPGSAEQSLFPAGGDGVYVQLGSVKSAAGAKQEWEKLVGEFPDVLAGRQLRIERVALANRGAFFRIRTGPIAGLTRAREICAEIASRDRGCLVVRR